MTGNETSYHWKPHGGRLSKYKQAKQSGQIRIPIDGNVYRILKRCSQGEGRMSWLTGSEFTSWDFEQCLVYGFIQHELGKQGDCTLTALGYHTLRHLDDVRKLEHLGEYIVDLEHPTRQNRSREIIVTHKWGRSGITVLVSCNVNEYWYQHFRERAW